MGVVAGYIVQYQGSWRPVFNKTFDLPAAGLSPIVAGDDNITQSMAALDVNHALGSGTAQVDLMKSVAQYAERTMSPAVDQDSLLANVPQHVVLHRQIVDGKAVLRGSHPRPDTKSGDVFDGVSRDPNPIAMANDPDSISGVPIDVIVFDNNPARAKPLPGLHKNRRLSPISPSVTDGIASKGDIFNRMAEPITFRSD